MDYPALAKRIKTWGTELGFQAVGIAEADVSAAEPRLIDWLAQGWHGEMEYMARNAALRGARPSSLRERFGSSPAGWITSTIHPGRFLRLAKER